MSEPVRQPDPRLAEERYPPWARLIDGVRSTVGSIVDETEQSEQIDKWERQVNTWLDAVAAEVAAREQQLQALRDELDRLDSPTSRAVKELVDVKRQRDALAEALTCCLNCAHTHREDDLWEYVEHEGKTHNRCKSCGVLELWEGGTFCGATHPALASASVSVPPQGGNGE